MVFQHLIRNPSLAPIPHRALLSITGSQSSEFLNGLLSTSIQGKPLNRFSSVLHAQGRVMHDVFLYATDNGYIMEYDSRTSEAPPLFSYFKRHVLRSKVKIRSVTEEYDVWASWGSEKDHSWEEERKWRWANSGVVEPSWEHTKEWAWGTEDLIIKDRRAVGMGRRLLVRKDERPVDATSHDLLSTSDYLAHRISRGVPEGIIDIPPMQAFPMESNLDIMGGLDFRKGCYVGQELTVRTYHTGVIRKRISLVKLTDEQGNPIASSIPENSEIKPFTIDESKRKPRGSGKLLSSTNGIGLALLRLEHVSAFEKGTIKFQINDNEQKFNVVPHWSNWLPPLQNNPEDSVD